MLYHSKNKGEAIKIWQETLASDKTNLNALQDITLAYQKLCRNLEVQKYEAQLRKTIRDASPDEKQMMFARCQAEQGYALSQDLQFCIHNPGKGSNCVKTKLIGLRQRLKWLRVS